MNIEIARNCMKHSISYDEALLYCFTLEYNGKRGWRLPTEREYELYSGIWGWHQDDDRQHTGHLYRVTPVRDVDKDG